MALQPGHTCFTRPARTKPRRYSLKDLERITGYVEDDGVPWFAIIAAVLVALGLGALFCYAIARLTDLSRAMDAISKAIIASALVLALRSILDFLLRVPPWIRNLSPIAIFSVIFAMAILADWTLQRADRFARDSARLFLWTLEANKICEVIRHSLESVGGPDQRGFDDELWEFFTEELPDEVADLSDRIFDVPRTYWGMDPNFVWDIQSTPDPETPLPSLPDLIPSPLFPDDPNR